MKRYKVFSPDGFTIHPFDTYPTIEAAENALDVWTKNFTSQGYYSSNEGRINLDHLKDFCKITEFDIVGQVVSEIEDAMGPILVENFPEITTGDESPDMAIALTMSLESYVKRWFKVNSGGLY